MKPEARLNRPIVGSRQIEEQPAVTRLLLRGEQKQQKTLVPQRIYKVRGDTRKTDIFVNAGPNAPQLIRLVKHPFVLSVGIVRRVKNESRSVSKRPERVAYSLAKSLATEMAIKEPRPYPMTEHIRFQSRTLPSCAEWLRGKE